MKALLTASVVLADKWNSIPSLGGHRPVSTETALRLNMQLYVVNLTMYGFDAMLNTGPDAVFSQIELKFKNAARIFQPSYS